MLGGIAIQMAAITIYTIIAVECISRYVRDKPVRGPAPAENMERIQSEASEKNNGQRGVFTGKLKLMVLALGISTLFIFMRSVYRVIEVRPGPPACTAA